MEILLAFIFGAAIGLGAHFLVTGRALRGVVVAPILGALLSGLIWMILTWAGVTTDSPWIWLASIVVPAALVPPVLVVLARTRGAHDEHERVRLGIG